MIGETRFFDLQILRSTPFQNLTKEQQARFLVLREEFYS